jgi:hypothetical protein
MVPTLSKAAYRLIIDYGPSISSQCHLVFAMPFNPDVYGKGVAGAGRPPRLVNNQVNQVSASGLT